MASGYGGGKKVREKSTEKLRFFYFFLASSLRYMHAPRQKRRAIVGEVSVTTLELRSGWVISTSWYVIPYEHTLMSISLVA